MPTPRVSTRIRRTSHRQGPRAPEHLVERMVVAAIGMVNAYTDRLMRALAPLLQARYGQSSPAPPARQDAATERPGAGGSAAALDDIFRQVHEGELSHGFLERMFHMVDRQAADDLGRVVPVPLGDVLPHAAQMKEAWIAKNSSLIRLEERAQKEVRAIITAPITEGVRVEEIRKQLEERLGVVRSRAELIARDQTLKLYGNVQEARQTEAGIVEYTWSGSLDERERKDHLALEGTTQRWDTPPVVDKKTGRREHPGGDFQCRCAAIPVLPDDEAPISETRPSVRPANDVPQLTPEEQAFAEPLPSPPDPVEQERQRLAEERAAREAERERVAAERAAAEAERQRQLEAQRVEAARLAEVRRAKAEAERQRAQMAEEVRVLRGVTDSEVRVTAQALERAGSAQIVQGGTDVSKLGSLEMRTGPIPRGGGANGLYRGGRTTSIQVRRTQNFTENPSNGPNVAAFTTTYMAKTMEESMATTAVHELGHHLHVSVGAAHPIEAHIQRAFAKHVSIPGDTTFAQGGASRYSNEDHYEFWAESYAAAVMHPEWTRREHPEIYAMVQEGLRLLRFKP